MCFDHVKLQQCKRSRPKQAVFKKKTAKLRKNAK